MPEVDVLRTVLKWWEAQAGEDSPLAPLHEVTQHARLCMPAHHTCSSRCSSHAHHMLIACSSYANRMLATCSLAPYKDGTRASPQVMEHICFPTMSESELDAVAAPAVPRVPETLLAEVPHPCPALVPRASASHPALQVPRASP